MLVEYHSNNSGGDWWLMDKDWQNLEAAGWEVKWKKNDENAAKDDYGRWLGALATSAQKEFPSIDDAKSEWESVIGKDADAAGCSCCGPPHDFYCWEW